jgi:hypothetical protein
MRSFKLTILHHHLSYGWLTPPDPYEDIPIYGLHCSSEGLTTTLGPDSLVFRGYFYRRVYRVTVYLTPSSRPA